MKVQVGKEPPVACRCFLPTLVGEENHKPMIQAQEVLIDFSALTDYHGLITTARDCSLLTLACRRDCFVLMLAWRGACDEEDLHFWDQRESDMQMLASMGFHDLTMHFQGPRPRLSLLLLAKLDDYGLTACVFQLMADGSWRIVGGSEFEVVLLQRLLVIQGLVQLFGRICGSLHRQALP